MLVETDIKSEVREVGSTSKQWIYAIIANTTLFTYGLQCGWISASTSVLQSDRSPTGTALTDTELSYLASAPSMAAVVSVSVYAMMVNKYGRKFCIMTLAVFQAIGWIIKICPSNTISLTIARVSCGIAGGACFNIVPMYVKEISQDNVRGTLGMLLVLLQYLGILAMYAMGGYLDYYTVLYLVLVIPILTVVFMIKAPESPAYLVKIGKIEDAASTIAYLRGVDREAKLVQTEIDAIQHEDEMFKSVACVSFIGIFRQRAWRNGFIFMIMTMIARGFNGGFTVITYASTVLKLSGVTISLELQSLTIPVFMILSSFFTMFSVERLGRKAILGGSFALATLSFVSLAALLIVLENGKTVPPWLPVVAIVASVCGYAAGVGPLPYVVMSEMFNFQIRAKVMGCLVTLGWLFSFVQLIGFSMISANFGMHIAFLCYAVVNSYGMCVVLGLLPETKGKSIEQIENELDNKFRKNVK